MFFQKFHLELFSFLVGAFFEGKMLDSYSELFFFRLNGPLLRETPETTKAKSGQFRRSANGPPFCVLNFQRKIQKRTVL